MKIDGTLKTNGPTKVKETKDSKRRILDRQVHRGGVQDEVELTGDAAKLQELEARLAELEITDPKKVEAIRQAIAEGRFKVDEEAVADALVNEAIDLLSQQGRR